MWLAKIKAKNFRDTSEEFKQQAAGFHGRMEKVYLFPTRQFIATCVIILKKNKVFSFKTQTFPHIYFK